LKIRILRAAPVVFLRQKIGFGESAE